VGTNKFGKKKEEEEEKKKDTLKQKQMVLYEDYQKKIKAKASTQRLPSIRKAGEGVEHDPAWNEATLLKKEKIAPLKTSQQKEQQESQESQQEQQPPQQQQQQQQPKKKKKRSESGYYGSD